MSNNAKGYELFFDGGICPHPNGGYACYYGWIVKQDGEIKLTGSGYEKKDSNVGSCGVELEAVSRGIRDAAKLGAVQLNVFGDSQTVIECINGQSVCHSEIMAQGCEQIQAGAEQFEQISFNWIPREQNAHADQLGRVAYKHSAEMKQRDSLIRQMNDLYERVFKNTLSKETRQQWHKNLTGKSALSQMSFKEIAGVMAATHEFVTGTVALSV